MGTLIIGLRAAEIELGFDPAYERRQHRPMPDRKHVRATLALVAQALRWLADRLEPAHLEVDPAG